MAQANSATLDTLWLLVMLVPFVLVIRYGASSVMFTMATARACGAGCSVPDAPGNRSLGLRGVDRSAPEMEAELRLSRTGAFKSKIHVAYCYKQGAVITSIQRTSD